jgi:hypothetical protein
MKKALVKINIQVTTLFRLISTFFTSSISYIPKIPLPSIFYSLDYRDSKHDFKILTILHKKDKFVIPLDVIYQSSNRFLTIFSNAKPPKIIKKIINRLEKANSLIIRLEHNYFVFVTT